MLLCAAGKWIEGRAASVYRFFYPLTQPYSLLTLSNNTCFQYPLCELRDRFNKLFKRKVRKTLKG